jgi:hypothetical protein
MTHRERPAALSNIISDTMTMSLDGSFGPNDDTRVLNEAFADFFSGQVVSGVNYFSFPGQGTLLDSLNMSYCAPDSNAVPCLDRNATGLAGSGNFPTPPTSGYLAIMHATTLFHDAFDGHNWRRVERPTNGDAWTRLDGFVTYTPFDTSDQRDESVVLDGSALPRWFGHWLARSSTLNRSSFFAGLADTMYEDGVTWCDACDVFALHSPELALANGEWTPSGWVAPQDRWEQCAAAPIRTWVGPPPEASLMIDRDGCVPCPGHHISNAFGVCIPCGPDQIAVGNQCVVCEPGSVPGHFQIPFATIPINSCTQCAETEISVNGQCVECEVGKVADRSTNTCVDCPVDRVIDIAERSSACLMLTDFVTPNLDVDPASCSSVDVTDFIAVGEVVACGEDLHLSFDNRFSLPDNADTCSDHSLNAHIEFERAGAWEAAGIVDASGNWEICEGDVFLNCGCNVWADRTLPASALAGVDRIRLSLRATHAVRVRATFGAGPPPR